MKPHWGVMVDPESERGRKIGRMLSQRSENVVVLEDIHDPHNAAAVWRSCDAFGIGRVYLIFNQEKRFNPKQVGKVSSASANKWLEFKLFDSAAECIGELQSEGYKVFATVLDQEAKSLEETSFPKSKVAIMLGNEHRGLSAEAVNLADEKIYIPMKGMVQSLNLSVTAAIMMWELERQKKRD